MRAAAEAYEKVVQAESTFAGAHYNLGNIYRDLGDYARSVASYQKAITLKPDLADAHQNLAAVYLEQGEFDGRRLISRRPPAWGRRVWTRTGGLEMPVSVLVTTRRPSRTTNR